MPDIKESKHQLHTIGDCTFCKCKSNKEFESVFRFLHISKTSARSYHTNSKEQNEQGKTDGLYCAVNIYNDTPNATAFEVLRTCGYELPYLSKFLTPSFKGIFEILNYPIITQIDAPPL